MTPEHEFMILISFPELRDALPYAQALSDEGIEHRISEKFLDFDPFFTGQRKMDQVKIEVAKNVHEAALAAIENVDKTNDLRVVKSLSTPKVWSSGKWPWVISSVVLLLSTLYFAERTTEKESILPVQDPLRYYNNSKHSIGTFWKHNNEIAAEEFDKDGNNIPEKGELYNRDGDLRQIWYDHDQNGMIDEWQNFDQVGRRTTSIYDRDGDGIFEELSIHNQEGDIKYLDPNGSGSFGTVERLSR